MRIHVLTPGFTTPNGRAFLFPLVVWRRALAEAGFEIVFFRCEDAPALIDADILLVDSKFYKGCWTTGREALLARFASWGERLPVAFCDTSDSSGWVLEDLLPVVSAYFKGQLLRDRALYGCPLYGRRLYADFYHRRDGVEDAAPETGTPVTDPAQLAKLRVSWNSGLADYSLHGPARMVAYGRLPCSALLRFPARAFVSPSSPRGTQVSCRFGADYSRASVARQRQEIRRLLVGRLPTGKLSRRAYFAELADSRVVVSPFGLGEITLKDFEVFLTGGLLLKPEMLHMETWPDFFVGGETMVSHAWDLADFPVVLDDCVDRYSELREIAAAGQERYRRHTCDRDAAARFCDHLRDCLRPLVRGL